MAGDYNSEVHKLLEVEAMARDHGNLKAIHELAMRELITYNAAALERIVEIRKEEEAAKMKALEEAAKARKAEADKEAAEAKKHENDTAKAHAAAHANEAKAESKHQRA
jgi:hypothetical protein